MTNLLLLIPVALFLGLLGLVAFLWALKSGQFDDLDGAAQRILNDEENQTTGENTSSARQYEAQRTDLDSDQSKA